MKEILFNCVQMAPTLSNIEYYAKIVSDSNKARKLKEIGTKLLFEEVSFEVGWLGIFNVWLSSASIIV